jgi:uncharacterized protein (TIGR03067 family)
MIATLCPDRQTLLRYSLGTLAEVEREALDSHLDACPDCQAVIVTLDDADDTAIGRLRMPLSGEAVLAEPQLQDALAAAMGMPAPMPEASDMPRMLGEYRLIAELGRGGMGRVYKALHTKLDRAVAVKVLPHGRASDGNATNRFAREMKAVGRLAHPNIVQAYDAREIDGTAVLIMELVDGLDLAEIVRRAGVPALAGEDRTSTLAKARTSAPRGIPVPDACELARQTALALQCAHENGLVHRDIKPSNIMLARSGEVKLLDLGLARFFAESGAEVLSASHVEEMTGTGQAMGTADYMAPEQASDSRTVDIRADIYSLGCTFYKLLTGRAPFSGPEYRTTLDKMNAHAQQPVPPVRQIVPDVPEPLAAVLDRMLAKDPSARFATPAEVAEAVAPFCAGADLPALLNRAETAQGESDLLPSPSGRGAGGEGAAESVSASPQPATHPRRWKRLVGHLLLLLLVGGLCFALGIVIRITKDDKTTSVELPPGSGARMGPDGSLDVTLPGAAVPALAGENRTPPKGGTPAPLIPTIYLKNAKAQEVARLLEHVFTGDLSRNLLNGPIRITTDARLNALIVQANQADLESIKREVEILDAKVPEKVVPPAAGRPADPAADLKPLNGQWTVVRAAVGDFTEKAWGEKERDDLSAGARFQFDDAHVEILYAGRQMYRGGFTVTAGSGEALGTIDLYTNDAGGRHNHLFALGAYTIERGAYTIGRLTLCLCRAGEWMSGAQMEQARQRLRQSLDRVGGDRNKFAMERSSHDILLQLERYRPTSDETMLKDAACTIRELIFNGEKVMLETRPGRAEAFMCFSEFGCEVFAALLQPMQQSQERPVRIWPPEIVGKWRYFLNPDSQPKTITFANNRDKEHCGIYKLEGDQLTIALQTAELRSNQRPEKLESVRGSGVALLTLQIHKKDESRHGDSSTAPPTPAAARLPTVRVAQPVVCNVCDYEEYCGRIEKGNVPVTAPAKGRILILPREDGKYDGVTVKAGDAIAEIIPENEWTALEPKVVQKWKRFDAARGNLENLPSASPDSPSLADNDKARQKALKEEKSAFDDLIAALGNVKSAKVHAPCSGVISLNQLLAAEHDIGTQIGLIEPSDVMLVSFDVPESTVLAHRRMANRKPDWEISLPVVCALADDKGFPYRGKVVSVTEDIDPKTRSQHWQAVVPNKNGLFLPGMSARLRVITSEPHKAMLIPNSLVGAIYADTGLLIDQNEIVLVDARNTVKARKVRFGRSYDAMIAVTEGLTADDWVVTWTAPSPDMLHVGTEVKAERVITPPPPWASQQTSPPDKQGASRGGMLGNLERKRSETMRPLDGWWTVDRIEKGKGADAAWSKIVGEGGVQLSDSGTNVHIHIGNVPASDIMNFCRPESWSQCASTMTTRFSSTDSRKIIEFYRWERGSSPFGARARRQETTASGIYEIEGDRLSIHLALSPSSNWRRAAFPKTRSATFAEPKESTIDPQSSDVLFVLHRRRASAAEMAIEGDWKVISRTDNGEPISQGDLEGVKMVIGQQKMSAPLEIPVTVPSPVQGQQPTTYKQTLPRAMLVILDAGNRPGQIAMYEASSLDEPAWPYQASGIYKLEGDRLTIAWRQGASRPRRAAKPVPADETGKLKQSPPTVSDFYKYIAEADKYYAPILGPPADKFESTPGSGITLLVLEKSGTEEPSDSVSAQVKPPVASAAPPVFRVTQPVVCNVCDYEEYTGTFENDRIAFDVPDETVRAYNLLPNPKPNWVTLPEVFVSVDGKGFSFRCQVVTVSPGTDSKTHSQRWQGVAPKTAGTLKPGASVGVRVIISGPHKVILIPGVACGGNGDEQWVYAVNGRNVVEIRKVKIVGAYDGFLAVGGGLKADDWILYGRDPYWKTRDILGKDIKPERITTPPPPCAAISAGMTVKPQEPPAGPAPAAPPRHL